MRVLIVDDEPLAIANLEHMLATIEGVSVVCSAKNGLAALHAYEARKPDLLLVDVDMPGMDGLSLVRELKQHGAPQIIFVTAFDRFASKAFDVDATDYVLKPVDRDRLADAIERARQRVLVAPILSAVQSAARQLGEPMPAAAGAGEQNQVYWAKTGTRSQRIAVKDIRHVEACKDYVFIETGGDRHMVRTTMAALEAEFAGTRIRRVHRSHMVNLQDIREVLTDGSACSVRLSDGAEIPVGRHYRAKIEAALAGR